MAEPTLIASIVTRKRDGRGTCIRCGGRARVNNRGPTLCVVCRRTCVTCGGVKSEKGVRECDACARVRNTHHLIKHHSDAVAKAAAKATANARRFADITESNFRNTMRNGRWATKYRDADGTIHSIYRYQWLWVKTYGPIPAGYHLHHKNGDHTDDRLDNLELMLGSDHYRMHGLNRRKPKWPCEVCGKLFRRINGGRVGRFCCLACFRNRNLS